MSFFQSLHAALDDLSVQLYSNFLSFGDFNIDVSVKDSLYFWLCSVIDHAVSLTITPILALHIQLMCLAQLFILCFPAALNSLATAQRFHPLELVIILAYSLQCP